MNRIGEESGNAGLESFLILPWLQDTDGVNAWSRWDVVYRDVVILDRENRPLSVYNLTDHDLGKQENYDEMKARIVSALAPPD